MNTQTKYYQLLGLLESKEIQVAKMLAYGHKLFMILK